MKIYTVLLCFALTGIVGPALMAQSSYTWNGSVDGSWSKPANWSPTRSAPASNDILQFDGTQVNQPSLNANETVGRLVVNGNTTLTITNHTGTMTLTATGGNPRPLDVAAGVELIIDATGTAGNGQVSIGTGAGRIFGTITIQGLAQLLCTDPNSPLVFESGAIFNASQTSGSPFGSSPVAKSVKFAAGATYNHNSGLNPFTLTEPNTAVIFDPASNYNFNFTSGSSVTFISAGRVYGNLTFDGAPGFTYDQGGGSREWTIGGNLTIKPGITVSGGAVSVAPLIAGNIINDGTWTPSTGVAVTLNGTAAQSISGATPISFAGGLTISNSAGITLQQSASVSGILTFTAGNITLGNNNLTLNGSVSGAGAGMCFITNGTGGVVSTISGGGSFEFPVSATGTTFNPLTIALPIADPTETFTVSTATGVNPSLTISSRAVQQTWTINELTPGGNNAALTFQWSGSQEGADLIRAGASAWRFDGSKWAQSGAGTLSGANPYTLTTTTPVTNFGSFIVASDVPVVSISSKNLAFGKIFVGQQKLDSITVRNSGSSTLNISSASSSDSAFKVTPLSGSIAPLDSQKYFITFKPSVPAAKNAMIIFADNTPAGFDTILVSGTGVQPNFQATPSVIAFGDVFKDSIKVDSITVINSSTSAALTIDSVQSDNPAFAVTPTNASIDTASNRKFYVSFHPTIKSPESGNIIFHHNAASGRDTVRVSGNGILKQPGFTANPDSLIFRALLSGQSRKDTLLVNNTGTDLLIISSVLSSDPDFSVSPTSISINPGASQAFVITYTPTNPGTKASYIIFANNGTKGQDTVFVVGRGTLVVRTIAQAKIDGNADYVPDLLGDTVTVIGVVNSVNFSRSANTFSYYIQDTTGGILITKAGIPGPNYSRGSRLAVTGIVSQFAGTEQLSILNLSEDVLLLDTGHTVTPKVVTISQFLGNPEKYEGSLIEINYVAKKAGSAPWPAAGSDATMTIWDGFFSLDLSITKDTDLENNPEPQYPMNITGIATQSTLNVPPNTGYRITPSYYADISQHVSAPPNSHFALISPSNGSTITLDDTAQVFTFRWNSAIDLNGDTLAYEWVPVGFTPLSAGNAGKDTAFAATGKILRGYLGSKDTVVLQWTVTAADRDNPKVYNNDTVSVTIIRGLINGIPEHRTLPRTFALSQNYPNPFNPATTITYNLPAESHVSLIIYNVLGQAVQVLANGIESAGYKQIQWNADHFSSGVYFYRLETASLANPQNTFSQVRRMLLIK